jgi:hypothetical protein
MGSPMMSRLGRKREYREIGVCQRILALLVVYVVSFAWRAEPVTSQPLLRYTTPPRGLTTLAAERPSWVEDSDTIIYHVATPDRASLAEEDVKQRILHHLVLFAAGHLPEVAPCQLFSAYVEPFGDFPVRVQHPSPARRLECLRGVVRYLLRENISEADFVAARANEVSSLRWHAPDPKYPQFADEEAERLALLAIYQTGSPRHQLLSVDDRTFAALEFVDFNFWLDRNRKAGRFTFYPPRKLAQALDLPVPDPMILELITSLASPRVPAGLLFFDGERLGVAAYIEIFLGDPNKADVDPRIRKRFACNANTASELGDGFGAIARAACLNYNHSDDVWFGLALRKAESASYEEFCQQVRALVNNVDIATVVKFSPEGSKGLYILLPPACKAPG